MRYFRRIPWEIPVEFRKGFTKNFVLNSYWDPWGILIKKILLEKFVRNLLKKSWAIPDGFHVEMFPENFSVLR